MNEKDIEGFDRWVTSTLERHNEAFARRERLGLDTPLPGELTGPQFAELMELQERAHGSAFGEEIQPNAAPEDLNARLAREAGELSKLPDRWSHDPFLARPTNVRSMPGDTPEDIERRERVYAAIEGSGR